jgi:hypothetical protein
MLPFEDAVDMFAEILHGLWDRVTWNKFAALFNVERYLFSVTDARQHEILTAQDERLGVWVNRVEEDSVLFLLHLRIPIFIIHEMNEYKRTLLRREPMESSFTARTDAVRIRA